jgi:hypothetical protein
MLRNRFVPVILLLGAAMPAAAGELVLPVFALNLEGRHANVWSSELYLTNPGDQPVLVELIRFLPGDIEKSSPCNRFMTPTRVVPPQSATVWTAAGLATDLGCADSASGGLVLRADGPLHVTSRLVNRTIQEEEPTGAILSGRGEAFDAIPVEKLPAAGPHLLPALMWHRNPCGQDPEYSTAVGFANPGAEPVEIVLDVPHEANRSVVIDGREVFLPYRLVLAPGSWEQHRLAPRRGRDSECGAVESFLVRLDLSAPAAVYASVIDRKSGDPRTVMPVPLVSP